MLDKKEKGNFCKLLEYLHEHEKDEYRLEFLNGQIITARYDTDYESENCLDLDDPNYEEYWGIAFRNLSTNELFEIS